MTHCWASTETVPTILPRKRFAFKRRCSKTSFLFPGKSVSVQDNAMMIVSEDVWMKLGLITTSPTLCITTIGINAHNNQFCCSVAPGHDLYWVVQVSPQSSTCPVQPSWHFMNYLYSSHWSTLESYSSNSQLFFYVFLLLWKPYSFSLSGN